MFIDPILKKMFFTSLRYFLLPTINLKTTHMRGFLFGFLWSHLSFRKKKGGKNKTPLHIKPEQNHIAILDDIVLALRAVQALFLGRLHAAHLDQRLIRHRLKFV